MTAAARVALSSQSNGGVPDRGREKRVLSVRALAISRQQEKMMSTQNKVALVVGAHGVIGRNLIAYLATLGDWEVIGLSRRDCREKLGGPNQMSQVTHIFYAAYQERPTWAKLVPPNLAMLVDDETFLMHTGLRRMFQTTLEGVTSIINLSILRWRPSSWA